MFATPSRTFFALPYWIAEHKGFFSEEGVEPTLEIIGDSNEIRDRLRAGRVRLSIDTANGMMMDALKGGPLRIVGGNAERPPLFLVARPGITTLEQLRGATFGVLSLKEGSSRLIPKILSSAGLTPDDFRIVEAGGAPARVTALREGRIDAALQPMPLHYEAEAEGFNCLAWAGDHEPEWQFNTINVNLDLARRDPQPIVAALRGLLRGLAFMRTDAEESARIGAQALGSEPAIVLRAVRDALNLGIFHPTFQCSEPGLRNIFRNMQDDGVIPRGEEFDMRRLTDPGLFDEARRG